ncbi:MAG: hypothetical protein V4625_09940 [Pseudomonadota bacterium]
MTTALALACHREPSYACHHAVRYEPDARTLKRPAYHRDLN